MRMTTWRKEISRQLAEHAETWDMVAACTLSDAELDRDFNAGYGGENGESFTLWTTSRVYFPASYDGAEWCASVPRFPCLEATAHVGGG